jgi:hypothetical protein
VCLLKTCYSAENLKLNKGLTFLPLWKNLNITHTLMVFMPWGFCNVIFNFKQLWVEWFIQNTVLLARHNIFLFPKLILNNCTLISATRHCMFEEMLQHKLILLLFCYIVVLEVERVGCHIAVTSLHYYCSCFTPCTVYFLLQITFLYWYSKPGYCHNC